VLAVLFPQIRSSGAQGNFRWISGFLIKGTAATIRNRSPTFIGQELGISPVGQKNFQVTY
jgi:hypothetical protein